MKVYVCYSNYTSRAEAIFTKEQDAIDWVKMMSRQREYEEMELL